MRHSAIRAAVVAAAGAAAGWLALAPAFGADPRLAFEMDRPLPAFASGFYAPERHLDETFIWTAPVAELRLDGLDRRVPWRCTVRLRGARPDDVAQPMVTVAVDGVVLVSRPATNDYDDLAVPAPARPGGTRLTLTIASSDTFHPGPADPRALGVQVDRLACEPGGDEPPAAPRRALTGAALAAAALGAAIALAGLGAIPALLTTLVVAIGQALPLAAGAAPYTAHASQAVRLAVWIGLAVVAATSLLGRWRRRPLSAEARLALAVSAAALYLKLLALLHPAKLVVDALFHAHRLGWVLDGRFYFTQPMPDGVAFPYAIGLYLVAAPWSLLTTDHVALLRIVVSASEAIAGALLYLAVARAWGDRRAGVVAVVLFHLVPLPYAVIGNANLTSAFGQAAALAAVVAAALLPLDLRQRGAFVLLTALIALALGSHVGTFTVLAVTLAALVALYRWAGGPALSAPAWTLAAATLVATALVVGLYYAHFGDAYRSLARVRADAAVTAPPAEGAAPAADRPAPTPMHRRAAIVARLGVADLGWPALLLAAAGLWRLLAARRRDRLALAVGAWAAAAALFLAAGIIVPVSTAFERYAVEFLGRVELATYPAVVVLAALGAAWGWRAGLAPRLASAALVAWAAVIGFRAWLGWLH